MNIKSEQSRKAILIMGLFGAQLAMSTAYAQEQIRLNPNYKAPTEQSSILDSNEITTEFLDDGFDNFLTLQEEGSDQYIMLTEPNDKQSSIISLNNNKPRPLLRLNHEYKYTPSLSFDLPDLGMSASSAIPSSQLGGSQLVLSLSPSGVPDTPYAKDDSVKLLLGSSYVKSPDSYASFLNQGTLNQQAYNLSLNIGYSGFRLGASYSRNELLFTPELSGYDLGVGYFADSWSANLRVGEYSRNRTQLLTSGYEGYENISAYELGAAYRLFSNVNLTGRFTYYSYGIGSEVMPIEDVKSLIFGTNVSF